MNKYLLILGAVIVLFAGCSKDTSLEESVFVNDPDSPGLPQYSEWGYNTFGAYYDRQTFISNNYIVAAKCIVTNNVFSFVLSGYLDAYSYYSSSGNQMSISFKISGFLPTDYKQLIALNDTTLNLTKTDCLVTLTRNAVEDTVKVIEGTLQFKRAQNLLVDTKQTEVILSGYFDLKILVDNVPVTISDGRFDVGIGLDNFYNY